MNRRSISNPILLLWLLILSKILDAIKPNIIIYMTDDEGYNERHSNRLLNMPDVAKLAAEGMTLRYLYTISVCAPSRWSTMTGSNEVRSNELDEMYYIPQITLPKAMRQLGYTTAIFAKYGPGDSSSISSAFQMGFDDSFIYPRTKDAHLTNPTFLERNGIRVNFPANNRASNTACLKRNSKCVYGPDLFFNATMQYITEHANGSKPFFILWAPNLPHVGVFPNMPTKYCSPVPSYGQYASKNWGAAKKGHAAMFNYINRDIKGLREILLKYKLDNNTYIIYFSDNGAEPSILGLNSFFQANFPLRNGKRSQYEGGIRVPGIIWAPGRVPPNTTSNYPMHVQNLLPTITELAGRKITKNSSYVSYAPIWHNGDIAAINMSRTPINLEICPQNIDSKCSYAFISLDEWPRRTLKLLKNSNNPNGNEEAYDITSDPSEKNDLINDVSLQSTFQAMRAQRLASRTIPQPPDVKLPRRRLTL